MNTTQPVITKSDKNGILLQELDAEVTQSPVRAALLSQWDSVKEDPRTKRWWLFSLTSEDHFELAMALGNRKNAEVDAEILRRNLARGED